jgi:AcrR family transcriptional regulator
MAGRKAQKTVKKQSATTARKRREPRPGPSRPPKFRRRAAARPDEVLDASLDLFIERGYAATRVEDIARRAGLSKGAVYLYFPSKEAILEALVRRAISPIAANAGMAAANYRGSIREAVSIAMRLVAARLTEPRTLAIPRLIMHEVTRFPELAAMYREQVIDKAKPVVEALVARGIASGEFRPVDPDLTVRSIIGPIALHIMLSEIFALRPKGGLQIDRLIDNHLSILFDGLAARTEAANV